MAVLVLQTIQPTHRSLLRTLRAEQGGGDPMNDPTNNPERVRVLLLRAETALEQADRRLPPGATVTRAGALQIAIETVLNNLDSPAPDPSERDELLRAVEAHMAEMDARSLGPGRDREDIDNDLYNVATRIRESSGPAPDPEGVRAADMLAEFHRIFGSPETDALWLRPTLHREERQELIEALEEAEGAAIAMRESGSDHPNVARPQIARELADVVYVAYGTALLYCIDLDAALREVHRANLSKVGDDGQPIRREDGKVLKGPNFRPPDMSVALAAKETNHEG